MDSSPYTEEELEVKLKDVGQRLLHPPSSIDELLILLEEVEKILPFVPQNPNCSRSMQIALYPAYMALIKDEIFKHPDPDVQVAVASCANEITKISAPEFSYHDDIMKEIFRLFMNAFKHLSCGSGIHYERAMRILEYMVKAQSCIMMIDLEMEPVIVEMFNLFLDTIKPNHCATMLDRMMEIMVLIIEESDDISVDLLRPLLSHVKKDREHTSPKSWELANSVFKKCAPILRDYVREAVKEMELNVNDYADIIASLCQDTPIGRDTVTVEEVAVQVANEEIDEVAAGQVANEDLEEVAAVQVENEQIEGGATVQVATVQFVAIDASGDGVSKMDEKSQAGPQTEIQAQRSKRGIKPSTLMRPEDGYYYHYTELKSAKRGQSKKCKSMMNQDNPREGSSKPTKKMVPNKVKEKGSGEQEKTNEGIDVGCSRVEVNNSADLEGHDKQDITFQIHESEYVANKVVESPMSVPSKAKQFILKEKLSMTRKKTPKKVVESITMDDKKEQANHSASDVELEDKNEIDYQKHTSSYVTKKVVESPKPAKVLRSKVDIKGSKRGKETTEAVNTPSSSDAAEKGKVSQSPAAPREREKSKLISQKHEKHESTDVLEKVVESSMSKLTTVNPSDRKEKGSKSNKQMKATKGDLSLSSSVGAKKEKACHSGSCLLMMDKKESTSQHCEKYDSANVLEKVKESSLSKLAKAKKSKVDERRSKKAKKMTKGIVHSSSDGAEKDQNHEKNEVSDVVEKVVESPMSKLAKGNKSKVEEKGSTKKERNKIGFVLPSSPVGEEKEKVVESPISSPTEAKLSEVNKEGSKKQKRKSKGDVPSSSVVTVKENISHFGAESIVKDKNEITFEKHESADFVEKVSNTPMSMPAKVKQSKVKRSNKQKRPTKSVVQSSTIGEKEKVRCSALNLESKKENETTSQELGKCESADVMDKVVESEDMVQEMEKEPMHLRLEYGQELVNLRIMVWWPLDETYYKGTVESYDPVTKKHKIKYDDDDEEILDMSEERWELFNERQPHQSSRESEAYPSPTKEHGNRNQMKATKRKAVSSKKEHAGQSSERSKSEGCDNIKSGHAALQSISVDVGSDDESLEANFSWKAKAMSRAGAKRPKTG